MPRTHGQCAAEARLYKALGLTHEDRIFCAIPFFHTYGMGACLFGSAASGATLVILEDPQPFLLQRHRALELIERERATIFPGVPFNFRLMAEAPAERRPVLAAPVLLGRERRCRGRASRPSASGSACSCASSTGAPRRG